MAARPMWLSAALGLPGGAPRRGRPPPPPARMFEQYEPLRAAAAHFRQAGLLPDHAPTTPEAVLRDVCVGLIRSGMSPLLDAACQTETFKDCLPNNARQRPLQVVKEWAKESQLAIAAWLNELARSSPPPTAVSAEEKSRICLALANAAKLLHSLAATLRALVQPIFALCEPDDVSASAEAASADALRCRLLEWYLMRCAEDVEHTFVRLLGGSDVLFRHLLASAAPSASPSEANIFTLLCAPPPRARPQAPAELLFSVLQHCPLAATLAAEVETLFLTKHDAAWLRAAHLALSNEPLSLAQTDTLSALWHRVESAAATEAPARAELSHTISHHVFQAQLGMRAAASPRTVVDWTVHLRSMPPSLNVRQIEALIAQGGCEAALLLLRRIARSQEERESFFQALLDGCEARCELSRLLRVALDPPERTALHNRFTQRGDTERLVLLHLLHPDQTGNGPALQAPSTFDGWSDEVTSAAYSEFSPGARAPDTPSLLLHTLRQLLPASEWDASRPVA